MAPDGPPVFLCSLKAGGVGLTLTAADYVDALRPVVEPGCRTSSHRSYASYRSDAPGYGIPHGDRRIGRGKDSRSLAERKSALSRSVIKADSAIAKSLTKDDLEFLFADPG